MRALKRKPGDQLLNFFILGTFSPLINRSAPMLLLRFMDERLEQLVNNMLRTMSGKTILRSLNFIVKNLYLNQLLYSV